MDPSTTPAATGGYTQGTELAAAKRLLFVSGQVPEDKAGHVPATFEKQAELVWRNVIGVLNEAGMGVDNLVKVTTFLANRQYREKNAEIRRQTLGQHRPALTVIITDIYDQAWLLEIEAIAAD